MPISGQVVPDAISLHSPALTLDPTTNEVNLVWAGSDSIFWSTMTTPLPTAGVQPQYNWTRPTSLQEFVTDDGPAVTSFEGAVWLAWKATKSTEIFVASCRDKAWSAAEKVPGVTSERAPCLVGTDDALHVFWREPGLVPNLWWATSTD